MFVSGCHRSGTSLLAKAIVESCSFNTYDKESYIPTSLDNYGGFYESKRLNFFNCHILNMFGYDEWNIPLAPPSWSDPACIKKINKSRNEFSDLSRDKNWLDKDPRLCLTYGAVSHLLLKRVPIVAAVRAPVEVAGSLYSRDGFELA